MKSRVIRALSGLLGALSLLSVLPLWGATPGAPSGNECNRGCMEGYATAYAMALLKHDPGQLPLSPTVRVTENGVDSGIGEGVWKSAVKFYSQPNTTQFVVDQKSGQVGMLGVIDVGVPAMFALRLKIEGKQITEVETMIKRKSDVGGPFQPEGYLWREAPYIRTIPKALTTSRDGLAKAADRYWQVSVTTHNGESIEYMPDCVHMENGMNTDWERPLSPWEAAHPKENPVSSYDGRIWTCAREATLSTINWKSVRLHRRLIDEERGLVMDWNLVDRDGPGMQVPKALEDGTPNAPPRYGPPSRGADGWPRPAGMLGAPTPMTVGPSSTNYHAQVFRIVHGRISREQVFWISLPEKAAAPFQ